MVRARGFVVGGVDLKLFLFGPSYGGLFNGLKELLCKTLAASLLDLCRA